MLGEDNFISKFKNLLKNKEEIKEIPRQQRDAGRPKLKEIFDKRSLGGKKERNHGIYVAHINYGYTLKEIADYLGIHYTTVSKIIKAKI